jgi:hypothetical protein
MDGGRRDDPAGRARVADRTDVGCEKIAGGLKNALLRPMNK